ncbi:diguanylate cyclase [uncultured Pseudacidovorax sp.]|uniref:GGDEF domain-containing protein n=1 Tax=uncultured Pseudacidovorax sp. TaxID=679313 RepID=UPI0025E703F2|nr:diguanylate cyclase [uncultured Pseudacidovorax sp.]
MALTTQSSPASQLLRPIARVLLITQLVALVLVVAGSSLLVATAVRYQSASAWVQHTYEVLDEIETVRTEALRGSLALRNYAIAPAADYLASTRTAARKAADASERLEALVQDSGSQTRRAFVLRAEVAELVGWMNSCAAIAERDGPAALLAVLKPRVEQDTASIVRKQLGEIEGEERMLLRARSEQRSAEFRRLLTGAGIVATAFLGFLVWSVVYASLLLRRSKATIQGLKESADLDPLTGLLNRRALEERFKRRSSSPLTVVALDLDNFKAVNDAYGHASGDEVLRVSADRLRHECRESDLIARAGGDEFVVVLTGVADLDVARRFCERLDQAMREPIRLQSASVRVGASIGFQVSSGSVSLQELLASADAVSYQAKSARKAATLALVRD